MDNKTLKYIGCGVIGLILLVIIISCVGGKKLTCTSKDEDNNTSTKYVFHFKDGQADSLDLISTITFDDEEKAKSAEKNYNETKDKNKDSDKVKYSVSRSGKKITVTIKYKDSKTIKNMLDLDDLSEKSIKESASHEDDITCK